MLNDNVKLWVEALRSGKYTQGMGLLRSRNDEYCCLGVACELYAERHPELVIAAPREDSDYYTYGGRSDMLPHAVVVWLGLRDAAGSYWQTTPEESALAEDNDNGTTFAEIADIIEREPDGLFGEDY